MYKKNTTLLALTMLALIGCGSGGSTTNSIDDSNHNESNLENNNTSNNGENSTTNYSYFPSSSQSNDPMIIQKMSGALQAQQFFSPLGAKYTSKYCFEDTTLTSNGSKEVKWAIASPDRNDASVTVTQYDKEDCTGIATVSKANYTYVLHDILNNGTRIEIDFIFKDGDDITPLVPYHLFGYDATKTFYTTLTASGEFINTQNLRIGLARPSDTHTGETENGRANDLSNFRSQNYFFGQYGTGEI